MITTPRLRLEPFLLKITHHEIFSGYGNPQVRRFLGFFINKLNEAQQQIDYVNQLQQQGRGEWFALRLPDNTFVGAVGYSRQTPNASTAELAYWLLPNFWRQGLATEALIALGHYLANKGLKGMQALTDPANIPSVRLLTKLGFAYSHTETNVYKSNKKVLDAVFVKNLSE